MSGPPLTSARPAATGGEPGRASATTGGPAAKTVIALVIGHDRAGAAILHTDEGRLTLASAARLAVGTSVTLVVRPDGSLREIASRPPAPGQPAGAGPTAGVADDLVRLGAPSAGAPRSAALPGGALLQVEVLHRIVQQGGEPFPGAGRGAAAAFRPGETLVLRVHAATAADGGEVPASRLPADFVAKATAGGESPRLSSPFGTLQIEKSAAPDPGGARLALRLTVPDSLQTATHPTAAAGRSAEPAVLSKAWPALHDLIRQAAARDPAAAALLRQDVPRAGDGFDGRVLAFVLGMAAEPADPTPARLFPHLAAHPESRQLFERLGEDLLRYARWAEPGAEWRTFVVPVLDGKDLTPFHLYVRDGKESSTADAAEAGIRFMVDVDLSRLGAIQLDGLYRRRHLALTMRSRRRLPPGFAEPLEEMFERAMLAAGMTGELRIESEAALQREALAPLLGGQRRMAI